MRVLCILQLVHKKLKLIVSQIIEHALHSSPLGGVPHVAFPYIIMLFNYLFVIDVLQVHLSCF